MFNEYGAVGGTEVLRENQLQCHSTWPDLGSNLGHHCGKLVTNCLSYGTAFIFTLLYFLFNNNISASDGSSMVDK
jgi:hypothetical protein